MKALGTLGYAVDRRRVSRIILRHTKPPHRRLVVPDHAEIAKGTLRALLREAGLAVDDLRRMLDKIGTVLTMSASASCALRIAPLSDHVILARNLRPNWLTGAARSYENLAAST